MRSALSPVPVCRGPIRSGRRFRIALGLAAFAVLSAPLPGAEPPPEAAAALVPFAIWVGKRPVDEAGARQDRLALAYYRGRLGAWLEAEYQVRGARGMPELHASLALALTRAARFNRDWDRARTWLAAAHESLDRVPAAARPPELVGDYYTEAYALRAITDVRVAYAALSGFINGAPPEQAFPVYRRLVEFAVLTGDADNYSKLATAFLTNARAWNEQSPGDGAPSPADRAVAEFASSLIDRGYAATAAQLPAPGIANPALRETIATAARLAEVARQGDAAIDALLANASPPDRLAALAGPGEGHAGLLAWLVRQRRIERAVALLQRERAQPVGDATGIEGHTWQEAWNEAVQRTAEACVREGRAADAAQLVPLFTALRPDGAIDVQEGLVALASFLGVHGQRDAARRALESLAAEEPPEETKLAGEMERFLEMRRQAADAVRQQKRAARAIAWADAGDVTRAREWLDRLAPEVSSAVRQRVLAAMTAAAAINGEATQAEQLADDARAARPARAPVTAETARALMPALIMAGRHEMATDELNLLRDADPATVLADVIDAVMARGRGNRVLEWMSQAPESYRHPAWRAYFAAALPEPRVPPLAPP